MRQDPSGGGEEEPSFLLLWERPWPTNKGQSLDFKGMGIMEKKMEAIIMENQMEKKMENEMETGIMRGLVTAALSVWSFTLLM